MTLEEGSEDEVLDRARRGVGGFRSGSSTTSVDHDEVLGEGARW